MSMLFALTFARFAGTRRHSDLVLAVVFAASILLSLRLKGFLAVGAVVAIVALAQETVRKRRVVSVALVGGLLLAGIYSLEANTLGRQVSVYTSSATTIRGQLYATSERVALDEFPLGVGFGRFGSYPSRLHYSAVYDEYGVSSVYGLSRSHPQYIDDTSWPSVLGETGYAGLGAYVAAIALVIWSLIGRVRTVPLEMRWMPLAGLCALAVILTDSLGSPALFVWVPADWFCVDVWAGNDRDPAGSKGCA